MIKQINVYTIDELPDIKDKIIGNFRNKFYDSIVYIEDYTKALDAFCEFFNIAWKKWDIDHMLIEYKDNNAEEVQELSGNNLLAYFNENYLNTLNIHGANLLDRQCYFTGHCIDEVLIDPIRTLITYPTYITFHELLCNCLHAWLKAVKDEYIYQLSDKAIEEDILINEYLFTEKGNLI